MVLDIILLIIGFFVIVKASDILVDAASSLTLKLKISKIFIALTIVAFGTCAPEVAISFHSVSSGDGGMAFANVVGSCIVNVFLIIGLASFIHPIKIRHSTVKRELPILTIITSIFAVLMVDSIFNPLTNNTFSRADAIILILLFVLFMVYLVHMLFRKNNMNAPEEIKIKYSPLIIKSSISYTKLYKIFIFLSKLII